MLNKRKKICNGSVEVKVMMWLIVNIREGVKLKLSCVHTIRYSDGVVMYGSQKSVQG